MQTNWNAMVMTRNGQQPQYELWCQQNAISICTKLFYITAVMMSLLLLPPIGTYISFLQYIFQMQFILIHAMTRRWYFADSLLMVDEKLILKLFGFSRMCFSFWLFVQKWGGRHSAGLNYDFKLTRLTCSFHHLTIHAMRRINGQRSISITPQSVIFHPSETKSESKKSMSFGKLDGKNLVAKAHRKRTLELYLYLFWLPQTGFLSC